jgi:hypothetical protein
MLAGSSPLMMRSKRVGIVGLLGRCESARQLKISS